MTRAFITACSNKYFPSVLNLIGSIEANSPEHPAIYIYDLGLSHSFKKILRAQPGVTLLDLPPEPIFWRAGYAWKTYIFNTPLADLNFYLDAGAEVLSSLDPVYEAIERDDYFAFSLNPGFRLNKIAPREYQTLFPLPADAYNKIYLDAGIFGFKNNSRLTAILARVRDAALAGLTLGFSPAEKWRNHGREKSLFVRDCPLFRHDQSVLNLIMRQELGDFKIHCQVPSGQNEGLIFLNTPLLRIIGRGYSDLPFARKILDKQPGKIFWLNLFLNLKSGRLKIKRALHLLK